MAPTKTASAILSPLTQRRSNRRRVSFSSSSTTTKNTQRTLLPRLAWVTILFVLFNLTHLTRFHSKSVQQRSLEAEQPRSRNPTTTTTIRTSTTDTLWTPKQQQQQQAAATTTTNMRYQPLAKRKPGVSYDLVQPGDYIYYKNINRTWDAAPIVLERYRLVFFSIPKVGCTVWKQLFRRMHGYENWSIQEDETYLPHNPRTNGLTYLYDYNVSRASEIMTHPDWTRVIMVRDPKQRFLSAFLDKSVRNFHRHIIDTCCPDKSCVPEAQTIPGFLQLVQRCDDAHWRLQSKRVDTKFWPYVNFVLHVEDAHHSAKQLLTRLGLWELYGARGWGKDGTLSMFESSSTLGHSNYAQWQHWKWYTPDSEREVEAYYMADYEHPLFGFETGQCLTCIDNTTTTAAES